MPKTSYSIASCPLKSLVDGTSDYWTASGSGTNEYYYNQSDVTVEPLRTDLNGSEATKGTLGSLTAGEWGWGDNDSLGSDTVYVRLSDGADPDSKTADYVECSEPQLIAQPSSGDYALINNLWIADVEKAGATFRLLRTDSSDTILSRTPTFTAETDRWMLALDMIKELVSEQKLKIHCDTVAVSVWGDGIEGANS